MSPSPSSAPGSLARARSASRRAAGPLRDKHVLYEASVQEVDADLDFFERIYRRTHGRRFSRLREDFCGTAALSCAWAARHPEHRAWGVDLHAPTLAWSKRHHLARLGDAAERVTLVHADVLTVRAPRVEVLAALNFSYWLFKTRARLRAYFRRARAGLEPGGLFFVDVFGGQDAMGEDTERRRIAASRDLHGQRVPAFTYIWEQKHFNPVNHHLKCTISFRLRDGTMLRRAFSYDWRMWTLPEICELMLEAGFVQAEVYTEGWDDDEDDTDGVFRRRRYFENDATWIGYVVGRTAPAAGALRAR